MNSYIRKIKKNSKALSPVVASIILIAVTVAVSVVVAAWLSGTAFNLMGNAEQTSITNVAFDGPNVMSFNLRNTGGATVTLNSATIDGNATVLAFKDPSTSFDIGKGAAGSFTVTLAGNAGNFADGAQYNLKLVTAKGNTILYTATYTRP